MTYLFGDSTHSDLTIDYIEFLREALDLSVQILAAHERMLAGAARAVEVKREGDAETTRLEALGAAQARAIEAFDIGRDEGPTAQCAQALLRGAAETVRSSIERVRAAGASDVAKIEDEARRDRERCVEALGIFLKRHDLPAMTTELRLQQLGGNGYAARLYCKALETVAAVMDLEIPPSHLFASVARVDKLVERLEVHAPESGGWLRKEVKLRSQRLDKEYIYAMVASPTETMVQLRSAADGSGVGFDLTIRADGSRVSLRRVGEASELPAFDLDETDSSKVRDFSEKLVEATADLRKHRKALVEAMIADTSLAETRDPKVIVERLVAAMAPVVREIAKRSLAPTELVLKRQTGDGRREEIFVARRDLQVKLRPLGAAARAVFAPLELGEVPPEEPVAKVVVAAEKSAAEKSAAEKSAVEKKRQTAAEKSIFAEALVVDKTGPSPVGAGGQRAMVAPGAASGGATGATATGVTAAGGTAGTGRKDEGVPPVRLDDSIERLIVSEETRKP